MQKQWSVHGVMLNHEHRCTCRTVAVQTDIEHPHLTSLPGQQTYGAEWAVKTGIKTLSDCMDSVFSELVNF